MALNVGQKEFHFCIAVTINMISALLTPQSARKPLTVISGTPIQDVMLGSIPRVILLAALLMLMAPFPEICLSMPNLVCGG